MENKLNLQGLDMSELDYSEVITIDGGGAGSENGAYLFGRFVGVLIGGPVAGIYYGGRDHGWW